MSNISFLIRILVTFRRLSRRRAPYGYYTRVYPVAITRPNDIIIMLLIHENVTTKAKYQK